MSVEAMEYFKISSPTRQVIKLETLIPAPDPVVLSDFSNTEQMLTDLLWPLADHCPDCSFIGELIYILVAVCIAVCVGFRVAGQVALSNFLIETLDRLLAFSPVCAAHSCETWAEWPCQLCSIRGFEHKRSCHFCKDCILYMWESQGVNIA